MLRIQKKGKTKVIINADDLGYSQERDEAAFSLIESGIVRSASLIVNMPGSKYAAERCLMMKFRPGLHINLTEGKPLSSINSSLTNTNGNFKPKSYYFSNQPILLYEQHIYEEVNMQVQWFIEHAHRLPTHIDGHNHIHMVPQIAKIISLVMQSYGIYKFRLPIAVASASDFNSKLQEYAQQSKNYYHQKHMISTDHFVGLDFLTGYTEAQLLMELEKHQGTVELMVHPGFQGTEVSMDSPDNFHVSPNRVKQYSTLKESSFQQFQLISWRDVQPPKNDKKRILLHCLMKRGTGNHTSCLRILTFLEQLNYQTYLRNIFEPPAEIANSEQEDIEHFCRQFRINLVYGINIYRSGKLILDSLYPQGRIAYRVPYYLMIAGTDANIFMKIKENQDFCAKAIQNAEGLVSLNECLSAQTQQFLKQFNILKEITLIPQSETQFQFKLEQFNEFLKEKNLSNKPYIIFPASIRKVKDIGFGLEILNKLIDKYDVEVYLFGPVLDQQYYQSLKPRIGRVKLLGTASHDKLLTMLKKSLCLINTSLSEGMSNAILEAQVNGIIPVVRAIDGNINLVEHNKTGLLFENPDKMYRILEWLIENPKEAAELAKKTKDSACKRFHSDNQKNAYQKLFRECFQRKERRMQVNGKTFTITMEDGIHPVSDINNRLFMQIPEEEHEKILDVGCGTGIMSMFYLCRSKIGLKRLILSDVSYEALGNCLYNIVQNQHLIGNIAEIVLIQSNMFEKIEKEALRYDVILANMPQTPFPQEKYRTDKNGGPDGMKYNKILLQHITKKQCRLILLYSWLSNIKQFFNLAKSLKLKILFQSKKQHHRISKNMYDSMCPNLSSYLLTKRDQGVCMFDVEDNEFVIGTQILQLE